MKKKHTWIGFGGRFLACMDCGKPYDASKKWDCIGKRTPAKPAPKVRA